MTRQKKEIIKKIESIQRAIYVDEELGFGMAPAGAYDKFYQMLSDLEEELAHLMHYKDAMEMLYDPRALGPP